MSRVFSVRGFPPNANPLKVKLFVKRTADQHRIELTSASVDSEGVQLIFSNDEDVDELQQHLHTYAFGGANYKLEFSEKSQTSSDARNASDEEHSGRDITSTSIDFSKALSWMDIKSISAFSNQQGLLLQSHDVELDALHLIQYFQDQQKSNGRPIKRAFCMHDGILILFENEANIGQVLKGKNQALFTIEGKQVKGYAKDIPDSYHDRLLLEFTSDEHMSEDALKMFAENVSPEDASFEIQKFQSANKLVVKYEQNLAKDEFETVLTQAKVDELDYSVKVSAIVRSDCITITGLPPNFDEKILKMKLESKEYGKKVTKIVKLKTGSILVHFSSFRHAEDLIDKYGENGWQLFDASLAIKPYFHCLSDAHHNVESMHKIDMYRKAMLDHQLAPMRFEYSKVNKEILGFAQSRPRYWQTLANKLQGYADVEVDTMAEETSIKVVPVSVNVAKDRGEFTDHCTKILDVFFAMFDTQEFKCDEKNLQMVRGADMNPDFHPDGSNDPTKDYKIRWITVGKDTAAISGITEHVQRALENIKTLTDINNDVFETSEGQYRWLFDSGMFSKLSSKPRCRCHIKTDDKHCRLTFYGNRTAIQNANIEFLRAVNLIVEVKLDDAIDRSKVELLTTHNHDRVTTQANDLLKKYEATLIVTQNSASIWCHVKNLDEARKAFDEALVMERMELNTSQVEVTQIQEWENEKQRIEKKNMVLIKTTDSSIIIVGFKKSIQSTKDKIHNCLNNFSMQEKIYKTEYGKAECILAHCHDFRNCDKIEKILVRMVVEPECAITLKGRKNPVNIAYSVLQKQTIFEDKTEFERFGIAKYFSSGPGKIQLDEIASANECIILVGEMIQFVAGETCKSDDKTELQQDVCDPLSASTHETMPDDVTEQQAQQTILKMFSYQVYTGDIMKVQCDAVVNSIGQDFRLSHGGQVCAALLNMKNSSLQSELNKSSDPALRVTTGGNLPTNHVIHVYFSKDKNMMKTRLLETLRKADELKCKSLAIPAIGTGASGMNESDIAALMEDVLRNFKDSLFLENVDIVIHNRVPESISRVPESICECSCFARVKSIQIGPITLKIKNGDITDESTMAIANSTGMVSSKILQKAGEKIQKEVHNAKDKYIRVTSGGKLSCKKIIHAVVPDGSGMRIKDCVDNILRRAENDGYDSLSLPAFGTGNLGIDCKLIARSMKESVVQFANGTNPITHLKEIVIVIKDGSKFPYFYREFFISLTGDNGQSTRIQNSSASPSDRYGVPTLGSHLQKLYESMRGSGRQSTRKRKSLANQHAHSNQGLSAKYEKTVGQMRVIVERGDITEASTDAIVNSVGSSFDLSIGPVSKAISVKAEANVQEEVSKLSGNIRVSGGGKLSCKKIIHVCFTSPSSQLSGILQKVFTAANNSGCHSLSVPAVGTGTLNITSKIVAKAINDAIQCWTSNQSSTVILQEIHVVIFDEPKFPDFLDVLIPDHRADNLQANVAQAAQTEVETKSPHTKQTKSSANSSSPGHLVDGLFSSVQIGLLQIKVIVGDLTEQDSDAIVNSVSSNFDLSKGKVSPKILQKGGSIIQHQLKVATGSELRVTGSGNLPCKKIVHAVFTTDNSKISDFIGRILKLVDDEKCSTVSMPALGTGSMRKSSAAGAKYILSAIRDFALRERSLKCLKDVSIVIFEQNKLLPFLEELTAIGYLKDSLNGDESKITLQFYSRTKNKIVAAKREIERDIARNFEAVKQKIPNLHEILRWKSDDITRMKSRNIVGWTIDENQRIVELTGRKDYISQVIGEIRLLSTELSVKAQNQSVALFSWKYGGPNSPENVWTEFDDLSNVFLEEAYQAKKKQFQFQHQGKICVVEFEKLIMVSKQQGSYQRPVKREVRDEFPKHWAHMVENEECVQVQVDSQSSEYRKVEQKLHKTVPNASIQSVHRIQNKKLYLRYYHERKRVQGKDESKQIERVLFHGTSHDVAENIIKVGFDRGYAADKNAAAYGRGTYFAKNASYSDQKKYSTPDANGTKTMLMTRVVTGDFVKGSRDLKVAPSKGNGEAYNCTVDDVTNPTIFVIFTDVGTYPEYAIKYKS